MVTTVAEPVDYREIIKYNENKVESGAALLLHAGNFIKDAHELNLEEKTDRFRRALDLNKATRRNTLHVFVNFNPTDKVSRQRMIDISRDYMTGIGFGHQPYLVYQHLDAGSNHLHIVSINIQPEGSRINWQNLSKDKSEPTRKALMEKYGLSKPVRRQPKTNTREPQQPPQTQQYGESPTTDYIAGILGYTLQNYNYTTIVELNALLSLYNIQADIGKPGSFLRNHQGLLYQMIGEDGRRKGSPVKSSSLPSKPGIKFLESKFAENALRREKIKSRLATRIGWAMGSGPSDWGQLERILQRDGIQVAPYMNKNGLLYELAFIDHQLKTITMGSSVGINLTGSLEKSIDPRQAAQDLFLAKATVSQWPTQHPTQQINQFRSI